MSDPREEPKIVVDEDWKARAQAEKEAARSQPPERAGGKAEPPPPPETAGRVPPASFSLLVSSLAAQAMTALGRVPDPREGHPIVRPDWAKQYIDTLAMLEEKTKGNLAADEAEMLSAVLHELRMLFLVTRNLPPTQPPAAPA